ncbi:hypothetical protein ASG40_11545 [Methylobacterium sp. Leaf399]|uniref:helix-turn-helix domain-containing protein n=1 Tax=Methylobacterium sp. Leaf399 TaxID=1736364 RepID=UPI0006FE1D88|nr:helix-turn-helix domain-containing protein [Methylobacterium sp. Leaf399]KQT08507.1 hypothetical protein ASG40_11545 [Methylobacterium sp. Leaf399]
MRAHAAALRAKAFAPVVVTPRRGPDGKIVEARPYVAPLSIAEADYLAATIDREALAKAMAEALPQEALPSHDGRRIVRVVSDVSGVSALTIRGPSRAVTASKARHIACWMLNRLGRYSLKQVARHVGDRDHTSIIHGCRRVDAVIAALGLIVPEDEALAASVLWAASWPRLKDLSV